MLTPNRHVYKVPVEIHTQMMSTGIADKLFFDGALIAPEDGHFALVTSPCETVEEFKHRYYDSTRSSMVAHVSHAWVDEFEARFDDRDMHEMQRLTDFTGDTTFVTLIEAVVIGLAIQSELKYFKVDNGDYYSFVLFFSDEAADDATVNSIVKVMTL